MAQSYNKDFDEIYAYDGLHRLRDMQRGRLNGTQTALTTQTFGQCWNLDATGNWTGFKETDNGSTWTLEQSRTANTVNEITAITNTAGAPWSQPRYDKAGNMTTLPGPAITGLDWTTLSTDEWSALSIDEWADLPASHTKDATYDAWNRLIKPTDGPTGHTIQENQYDARTFRTVRKDYEEGLLSETRHFYYSPDWRCVEERVDTSPDADRQFVWGLRYIDELICRDRDTDSDGDLDERLYACQDAQASVGAIVNDAGSTVECYSYSPFGTVTFLDPNRTSRGASFFSFEDLFTGRQRDESTGLLNFRNRMISPEVGSFTQRDLLDYVNGPSLSAIYFAVSGVDPEGLRVGPPPSTRPGIGWGGRPVVKFPGYHYPPHSPGVLPSDAGPQMPPDFSFPSGPSIYPAPGSTEWNDWAQGEGADYNERRRAPTCNSRNRGAPTPRPTPSSTPLRTPKTHKSKRPPKERTCDTDYFNYPKCASYPHRSPDDVFTQFYGYQPGQQGIIFGGDQLNPSHFKLGIAQKCPEGGLHWDIRNVIPETGKVSRKKKDEHKMGSIICCFCCEDTDNGPTLGMGCNGNPGWLHKAP